MHRQIPGQVGLHINKFDRLGVSILDLQEHTKTILLLLKLSLIQKVI